MEERLKEALCAHYGAGEPSARLVESLRGALTAQGRDPDVIDPAALGQLTELHVGGRAVTVAIAQHFRGHGYEKILDIGCGLGGLAFHLADTTDCQILGIDPSESYIEAAEALSARLASRGRASFRVGSAPGLDVDSESMDGAALVQVAVNVTDLDAVLADVARVLRPGGRLILYDVAKQNEALVPYPQIWANSVEMSFPRTLDTYRAALERAGLVIRAEVDHGPLVERILGGLVRDHVTPPIYLSSKPTNFDVVMNFAAAMKVGALRPFEWVADKPTRT